MGMSADRAYKLQNQLKTRLQDIISSCIAFRATHAHIIERVNNEVFKEATRRKAPQHVVSYLRGVYDTRMDSIWQYHMVWCMWVDGQLLTSEEMKELAEDEIKRGLNNAPDYNSPWGRCDGDKSVHVWKDHTGKALKDKPYSKKEEVAA